MPMKMLIDVIQFVILEGLKNHHDSTSKEIAELEVKIKSGKFLTRDEVKLEDLYDDIELLDHARCEILSALRKLISLTKIK